MSWGAVRRQGASITKRIVLRDVSCDSYYYVRATHWQSALLFCMILIRPNEYLVVCFCPYLLTAACIHSLSHLQSPKHHPTFISITFSVQPHHSFFSCHNPLSTTFLFLSEGHQPIFPSRITLSLESASQGTFSSAIQITKTYITLIWSHTCQFIISSFSTVTIHYSFSLPLQTQNSSFPQIFSSIVLLPLHPPHWLRGCFSLFSGMSVLTLALCARLSWHASAH